MTTINERETHLLKMRDHLNSAKLRAELLCYGYEITDAINELIDFVEYDLGEIDPTAADEFHILNDHEPEIYCAKDWWESLDNGWFNENGGSAYWGTESHYSYDYSGFEKKPDNATHVHWLSK